MLSIVFPDSEDGQADAVSVIDDLPQLVGNELVDNIVGKVPAGADGAWLYEAFPGEIHDVSIYGGMLDAYLFLDDSAEVALYRIRPAVAKEIMGTEESSGWGVGVEGAVEVFFEPSFELRGPDPSLWTVGFSVGLHAGVTGSIGTSRDWAKTFSPLDQWLDMADARAVLPNSAAFGSFDALAEAVVVCFLRASIEDPHSIPCDRKSRLAFRSPSFSNSPLIVVRRAPRLARPCNHFASGAHHDC